MQYSRDKLNIKKVSAFINDIRPKKSIIEDYTFTFTSVGGV